jgi:hypothetical protein
LISISERSFRQMRRHNRNFNTPFHLFTKVKK